MSSGLVTLLVGPAFVRSVIKLGRWRKLTELDVVEVRPYTAPCGTFGNHVRLWRLLVPSSRSLKGHTGVRNLVPVLRGSGYGAAACPPRSRETVAPFSNVCIRQQTRIHNGGCEAKKKMVKYQMSAELPTKHQDIGVAPLGNLDE